MAMVTVAQLVDSVAAKRVLLDVRWSLAEGADVDAYRAGHLVGAVFLDLDSDVCGPHSPDGSGGRHPLPDPAALQGVLRRAGVDDDTAVVVYDDGSYMSAARTWWTLRWAGLANVQVLTGGYPAAVAAGVPTTTEVPAPEPGDVTVRPGALPVLDAGEAADLARRGGLYDVRAAERYRGEVEPIDPVAGHVPGAHSLPADRIMADRGRGFRPPAELAEVFDGIDTAEAGLYCGSGVTAARTALAMTSVGLPTPAVYIGSWSDWTSDLHRPVATGDE
ncbi:sulfurtransferase [Stackebrandtia albiflava]|nr:sulfurtransferase [Stackebrandtia albiflava]